MAARLETNNLTRRTCLGDLKVAASRRERRRGLLGTDGLRRGDGLVLRPCRSVHTFGMRYPIDVIFLDREGRVLRVIGRLRPRRMTLPVWRAATALELPAGTAESTGTRPGDRLELAGHGA
ncbi:MAG: DUF192 domain-containing protein [Candidatus Geothermincolia bacterium]